MTGYKSINSFAQTELIQRKYSGEYAEFCKYADVFASKFLYPAKLTTQNTCISRFSSYLAPTNFLISFNLLSASSGVRLLISIPLI